MEKIHLIFFLFRLAYINKISHVALVWWPNVISSIINRDITEILALKSLNAWECYVCFLNSIFLHLGGKKCSKPAKMCYMCMSSFNYPDLGRGLFYWKHKTTFKNTLCNHSNCMYVCLHAIFLHPHEQRGIKH